jgi:hypothetical protein
MYGAISVVMRSRSACGLKCVCVCMWFICGLTRSGVCVRVSVCIRLFD